MSRHERLLRTILRRWSDANIRFDDLRALNDINEGAAYVVPLQRVDFVARRG